MQVEEPPALAPERESVEVEKPPTVPQRSRVRDLVGGFRMWVHGAALRPHPIPHRLFLDGLKAAALPFLVSRFLVWVATGWGARNLVPPAGMYTNLNPPPAIAPLFRWDADAYGYIAHHGYALGPGGVEAQVLRVAWFPFYPLLIRLAGGSDWAMIIISHVAFYLALVLLYVVAVRRMEHNRAALSMWLVALGPAAMFFSYPYTESLFLLTTVGAFVLMESGHWLLAGLAGAAAAATRFPGVLLSFALAAERSVGYRRWPIYAAVFLTLGGLGAVMFLDWYQMGDPLGFYHARAYWIGPDRNPLYLVGSFPKAIIEGDPFNAEAIGVPIFLLFAVGAAWATYRMPIAYGAFAALQILVAGEQGLYLHMFSLVPRAVSVIFPCYFAFATLLAPRRNLTIAWLLLSTAVMVFNAAMYGGWRFIG